MCLVASVLPIISGLLNATRWYLIGQIFTIGYMKKNLIVALTVLLCFILTLNLFSVPQQIEFTDFDKGMREGLLNQNIKYIYCDYPSQLFLVERLGPNVEYRLLATGLLPNDPNLFISDYNKEKKEIIVWKGIGQRKNVSLLNYP
jgi:hypothetical protein